MNTIRKPRRYMLFNLSVFDSWTDEERVLYSAYKRARKDEAPTLKELYDEKLRSYVGIRKIDKSAMFLKDGDIRLDKVICGFENEAVRLCDSFTKFEFDDKDQNKIPLVQEFIIMDCRNEILLNQIIDNGIEIGEVHYFVFSSSANQQKKQQVCLIQSDFFKKNQDKLMCGLSLDIINQYVDGSGNHGCNTGKYLAYTSLIFSKSVELPSPINIDEVLVLPEFETLVTEEVNYLDMDTQVITKRTMPVPVNHMDGAGMFLPGVLPCSAQIRCGFLKGCIFPFNFRKFIIKKQQEGKITDGMTVKDVWGNDVAIDYIRDNIKLVLNGSQLKMWKYYESWETYKAAFKRNQLSICINNTLHYPMTKNPVVGSAYQFYHTIPRENVTDEKIQRLCAGTIDIINDYKTNPDKVLEIMGINSEEEMELEPFYAAIKTYPDMIHDPYTKKRTKSKIDKIRRLAMGGKPFIEGFYNYICPDLYAACEHWFCGEENPTGLIPKNHVYNSFYNNREDNEVCCLRSPHLSDCEHGIRQLIRSEECKKWFHGMDTVISVHDLLLKTLQADVDGDELLITSDSAFLDLLDRNKLPLYYEMRKANPMEVTKDNIKKCLKCSFDNSQIGYISNALTKHLNGEDKPDLDFVRVLTAYNNFCIDNPKSQYMPVLNDRYQEMFEELKDEVPPYFFHYAKETKRNKCALYHEKSNVNRISKYVMRNTRNNKDNIWKPDVSDNVFNPQYFQIVDYRVDRSTETYQELRSLLSQLKQINDKKFNDRLKTLYQNEIKKNLLGYKSYYYYCNRKILETVGKNYKITDKIGIRRKAAAYLLDIEYYQEENLNLNKDILWNCFGDILYENLCNNLQMEANGSHVGIKKLAYQSRCEKNRKIEEAVIKADKEVDEKYQVVITENEFEYICSLHCRKNCQRDKYLLFLLLVLYKRKLKYLDSLKEQDSVTQDNTKYFRIYRNARFGRVTRATLDKWLGDIYIARKGMLRFKEKGLIDIIECVTGGYDKIYPKFVKKIDEDSRVAFYVNNWNPMIDYYSYTKEAVIKSCEICKKPFVVIGNRKTCSDYCSRILNLRNKNGIAI